jgi:hypothetical protein
VNMSFTLLTTSDAGRAAGRAGGGALGSHPVIALRWALGFVPIMACWLAVASSSRESPVLRDLVGLVSISFPVTTWIRGLVDSMSWRACLSLRRGVRSLAESNEYWPRVVRVANGMADTENIACPSLRVVLFFRVLIALCFRVVVFLPNHLPPYESDMEDENMLLILLSFCYQQSHFVAFTWPRGYACRTHPRV